MYPCHTLGIPHLSPLGYTSQDCHNEARLRAILPKNEVRRGTTRRVLSLPFGVKTVIRWRRVWAILPKNQGKEEKPLRRVLSPLSETELCCEESYPPGLRRVWVIPERFNPVNSVSFSRVLTVLSRTVPPSSYWFIVGFGIFRPVLDFPSRSCLSGRF